MARQSYETNDAGDIIDPPIIGDHERRIVDAQATGDENLVHALTTAYHEERRDIVDTIEQGERGVPDDGADADLNWGEDPTDAEALTTNNSYEDLRAAARARDLPTSGGKIDLAGHLAEYARTHGNDGQGTDPQED